MSEKEKICDNCIHYKENLSKNRSFDYKCTLDLINQDGYVDDNDTARFCERFKNKWK